MCLCVCVCVCETVWAAAVQVEQELLRLDFVGDVATVVQPALEVPRQTRLLGVIRLTRVIRVIRVRVEPSPYACLCIPQRLVCVMSMRGGTACRRKVASAER